MKCVRHPNQDAPCDDVEGEPCPCVVCHAVRELRALACPTCEGKGERLIDVPGLVHFREVTCEACNGTGWAGGVRP